MSNYLQLHINNAPQEVNEELVLYLTKQIYAKKTKDNSIALTSPTKTMKFIKEQNFTEKGYKLLILDSQNQFLCFADLTINEFDIASTNMSEAVKTLIRANGSAVIIVTCKPDTEYSIFTT